MIDATTHTRKIWRSHFDGADSTWISPMDASNFKDGWQISFEYCITTFKDYCADSD
jgi:hypothetical protein